ncbi:MAG: M1 family metallopeptidase, partial [Hyphomonadaceae bacterium]
MGILWGLAAWALFALVLPAQALAEPAPGYDPRAAFAPLASPQAVNAYRGGDGAPGPAYWTNRADYDIRATLDPVAKTLAGVAVISYANNSPNALDVLWLHLDQNIYREDSRSGAMRNRARPNVTDGFVLEKVEIISRGRAAEADYIVSDTRMQIRLPRALGPGGRVQVRIAYHYAIPGQWGGRTSWVDSPSGPIFDIAQWYPRMAVYDDLRGWDAAPYLGQEFYLDYGDFDYAVTAPADMIVAGSGALVNAREVLTREQRARLAAAAASDATVMIRTPEEARAAPAAEDAVRTWRFHMSNTRDVAFAASRAFVWDAARIALPDGRASLAMSFYPPESAGAAAWGRSTEYLKHAVEEFSRRWMAYPYPAAINVGGGVSGMEYPGLVFDGMALEGKALFWLTAHEIGHTWFPMIVGSNERRDAFMDEGFNTFIDVYESDAFEGGVYGPKRDSEYAPGGGNPADEILPLLEDAGAPPIMTRADSIAEPYRHTVNYFKTALGLVLLREQVLGPARFDPAFRAYIRAWAWRHPTPWDFFRFMESHTGEDLAWFWRGWFLNNWRLDQAITQIAYVDGDPAKGAMIT